MRPLMMIWIVMAVGAGGAEAQSSDGPDIGDRFGEVAAIDRLTPADTLYREARRALTRREYERAITLFTELRQSEPESIHLADALYYEALARVQAVSETFSSSDVDRDALLAEVMEASDRLEEARSLLAGRETREPVEETARLRLRVESVLAELAVHRRMLERGDTVSLPLRIEAERREVPFTVGTVSRTGAVTDASVLRGATSTESRLAYVPFSVARVTREDGSPSELPADCDPARLRERVTVFYTLFDRDPAILDDVLEELESAGEADACAMPLRSTVLGHALATGALDRDRVVQAVRNEPDPFTRRAALHAIREWGDPEDRDLLFEIARTDDDQTVRLLAAHTLLELPDGAGRDRALSLVEEGELEPRGVALIISDILKDASADEAARIRTLFETADDDHLRTTILAQLSTSPREADRAWVRERVGDRTLPAQMRAAALNQASWRGADMDFLLSVYRDTDETLLRRQILWALAGSPSQEATDALIRAYRESDSDELRSATVNALTQRDDERAHAALRAILRGEDP
ncbi:MAG: hypothetical protein EA351_01020 [Gemmatimonadales bacterium]|nr:MAG: hypothetical protein EA351_01020 [Gemmatimonadales bacterium]